MVFHQETWRDLPRPGSKPGPKVQHHRHLGRAHREDAVNPLMAEAIVDGLTPEQFAAKFDLSTAMAYLVYRGERRPGVAERVQEIRANLRDRTLAHIEVVQREALERVRKALGNLDDRIALKAARQAIRDWTGPYAATKGAVVTVNNQSLTITQAIRIASGVADELPVIEQDLQHVRIGPPTTSDNPPPDAT